MNGSLLNAKFTLRSKQQETKAGAPTKRSADEQSSNAEGPLSTKKFVILRPDTNAQAEFNKSSPKTPITSISDSILQLLPKTTKERPIDDHDWEQLPLRAPVKQKAVKEGGFMSRFYRFQSSLNGTQALWDTLSQSDRCLIWKSRLLSSGDTSSFVPLMEVTITTDASAVNDALLRAEFMSFADNTGQYEMPSCTFCRYSNDVCEHYRVPSWFSTSRVFYVYLYEFSQEFYVRSERLTVRLYYPIFNCNSVLFAPFYKVIE